MARPRGHVKCVNNPHHNSLQAGREQQPSHLQHAVPLPELLTGRHCTLRVQDETSEPHCAVQHDHPDDMACSHEDRHQQACWTPSRAYL